MKHFLFHIFFFSVLLANFSLLAQTRKELENKRTTLKKEIKQVNTLLFNTKKKRTNALEDLKDLNQKISIRERLIKTIELEALSIESTIEKNKNRLQQYEEELAKLKKDYTEMVVKTYKSKSKQNKAMFLLSSRNFYQAYKRLRYMQQYNDFRKNQGEEILIKQKEIAKLNDSLVKRKKIKEELVTEEKGQKEEFETDKKSQEKLISKIKKEEGKYKRVLLRKQKQEKKVRARIDKLIRDAIVKSNKNKKTKAKKANEFALNEEEKNLLVDFEQNKGNLPWPVKGIITRKFGVQPHPTFPGININSTGLHIATKTNSDAKSIFNGKVLVIQKNPDGRKSVLVQHGNYISAYNNLEKVYVKKGEIIKTGDGLGKIFTDKVTGKTKLGFILYKNTKRLNPSLWIQ